MTYTIICVFYFIRATKKLFFFPHQEIHITRFNKTTRFFLLFVRICGIFVGSIFLSSVKLSQPSVAVQQGSSRPVMAARAVLAFLLLLKASLAAAMSTVEVTMAVDILSKQDITDPRYSMGNIRWPFQSK